MKQHFDVQEIEAAMRENKRGWIRRPEYFASIDSSNAYLLGLPESVHGRVCIADYQTRGKGRMGRQWHSSAGVNLMFSLGWQPHGRVTSELSLVAGLALADGLHQAGVSGVGLKWPNDVMVNDRKLAGVLIETRNFDQRVEFVLGIGLNIRLDTQQMAQVKRPWTDLAQLGMTTVDRQALLVGLLLQLAQRFEQLESQGFEGIREDWLAYHLYQDAYMSYQRAGETRVGHVVGLGQEGALLLESNGERVAIRSGEVSCLRSTR